MQSVRMRGETMPLVRLELRNEYSLGAPEAYTLADKEDPKEILEGVAVAGLVGLLRQLGDLAEFAAELFHGLQEEVTTTASRSHKLITRVKRVEAALSPLEKVILAQRTHLHFAYTAGTSWQTRIRCGKSHFVLSDVPNSIMDIYEECRGPPRLQLLDRFDPGGPGSCLKRYSDPTVFKRASAASDEASTEETVKDKKGHKIKRRRPWPRSGRVSKTASFSYNNDRMQFAQLNSDGHTSHSHTAATCDASLRSGSGKQSTFGFGNCSGRVEGDFRPSYSEQPEEQDQRVSTSPPLKRHDSGFLDFNLVEEKNTGSNDNVMKSLSLEQVSCSSTSVTCDEKTGAMEHKKQESDKEVVLLEDECKIQLESFSRDLECLPDSIANLRTQEKLNAQPLTQARLFPKSFDNLRTPDTANGHTVNHAVQSLESDAVHVDDMESETDQFLDALNTIESECENEPESGGKKIVERHLEDKGIDDGVGDIMRHNLECHSFESNMLVQSSQVNVWDNLFLESPLSPHEIFQTNAVAEKDANNSECLVDEALQLPLMAGESLTAGSLQILNLQDNGKIDSGNSITSVSCTEISSVRDDRLGMPINQGTKSSLESEERAAETLNASSATFWTNGGLLGLQPSKPPDFYLPNVDQIVNSKNIGDCLYTNSSKGNECLYSNGISSRKTAWKISPADLDIKLGKLGDVLQLNNNANASGYSVTALRGFRPVSPSSQGTRKDEESSRSSSRIFQPSKRLVSTGSEKRLLAGGDDNGPAIYQTANTLEQKNHQSAAYRTVPGQSKDFFGGESLAVSPSSSPPLQHMKISFQPINGLETSKLKLKFPHGDANSQTDGDIFPSFQLVPDVSVKQKSIDSDSDADTFCGSSPSLSDDCPSNQSDFHSEWESNESPTSKECDLYDSLLLHRVSLMESASTASENRRTNHLGIQDKCGSQSHCADYGLQNSVQSSDTINSSLRKKLKNDTNFKDFVDPELTHGPAPPPLPPVQWRGMRAHIDGLSKNPQVIPEGFYAASTTTQPKPAPLYEESTDTTNMQKSKGSSSLMLPGEREAYHDKSPDENDFLRQIRTKSFNLRPTMTAKPTVPSGASTKVPVNVLLKKANAIRQAVGSDGDEDGSWSET